MKKINRNNYEEFALDYLENKLNAQTKLEFENFLDANPDIKTELEDILEFSVSEIDVVFDKKNEIKKSEIDDINFYEYLCISDIENVITAAQKNELEKIFNENPDLLNEYRLFSETKLPNPNDIFFNNKYELKKSGIEDIDYLEYLMIAYSEGLLNNIQLIELQKITNNNKHLKNELELYKKTKLSPTNIKLPFDKNELKVKPKIANFQKNRHIIYYIALPIAALLVLFLGINLFFNKNVISTKAYETNFVIAPRIYKEMNIEPKNEFIVTSAKKQTQFVADEQPSENIIPNKDLPTELNEPENDQIIIAFEDDLQQKNLNYQVSNFSEQDVLKELPTITHNNLYNKELEKKRIIVNNTQKVLNFVVKQYNTMTENEVSVNLDLDSEKNCYVVDISEKKYQICLDKFKWLIE